MTSPQKFAICNETFAPLGDPNPWPFQRICAFLQETGYEGVELAPFTFGDDVRDVSAARRAQIRRIAGDSGLEICSLHWLLVTPPGLHIHSSNATLRKKTRDYLLALIDFAADVGAPLMVLGSPKARGLEGGDLDGAWSRTIETLTSLTERLDACGITLCPEALPAPEADFLLTQAEIARLCDEIAHPRIQMMLDVKSLCSEPDGPPELLRRYGSRAAHLHANDQNRRGPGSGDTDFSQIAAAAKESGFDGWVSVEVFDYSEGAQEIAIKSLNHLKTCWSQP